MSTVVMIVLECKVSLATGLSAESAPTALPGKHLVVVLLGDAVPGEGGTSCPVPAPLRGLPLGLARHREPPPVLGAGSHTMYRPGTDRAASVPSCRVPGRHGYYPEGRLPSGRWSDQLPCSRYTPWFISG